jgi:hypothetical protein
VRPASDCVILNGARVVVEIRIVIRADYAGFVLMQVIEERIH